VPGETLTLTVTAFNAVPYVGTVSVDEGVTGQPDFPPRRSALLGNYPNPCNPTTTIRFELARPGPVRLGLYDARGRLVRTLLQEARPAGTHEVAWDGTDDTGRPAASGVYHARLVTGSAADTRPLVLVR